MNRAKFILQGEARNIVNNYEIESILQAMVHEFPDFEKYIYSNVRNYVIKSFPCIWITERMGHKIFQDFYHFQEKAENPEVIISKDKNPDCAFHQIIISLSLLSKIRTALNYLVVHEIPAKANCNINDLFIKSESWQRKLLLAQDTKEGLVAKVLVSGDKTWVELQDFQAFNRESALMKNCVKNYFPSYSSKACKIYSLRDKNNKPLVTIEVRDDLVLQIKGISNLTPVFYDKEINHLMKSFGLQKKLQIVDFDIHALTNYHPLTDLLPYHGFEDLEEVPASNGLVNSSLKLIMVLIRDLMFLAKEIVYFFLFL